MFANDPESIGKWRPIEATVFAMIFRIAWFDGFAGGPRPWSVFIYRTIHWWVGLPRDDSEES